MDFTDVRAFLVDGGQKGLQRKILREGTYAINLAQFVVLTADAVYALRLPGQPTRNESLTVAAGDAWGLLVGPSGDVLPLQMY